MTPVARGTVAAVLAVALLSGCATVPQGPSVMVLPGSSKSFEQFQVDDAACRQWASHADRHHGGQDRDGQYGRGRSDRYPGRRRRRRGPRGCGGQCRRRRGGRSGRRPARRHRGRGEPRRRLRRLGAAPLRHELHAVHVRQGQPGAGRAGLARAAATGVLSGSAAPTSAATGELRIAHDPAATAGTAAAAPHPIATPARRARANPLSRRRAAAPRYGRRGGGGGGGTVALPAGTHTQ